jgi:hypothetical protein
MTDGHGGINVPNVGRENSAKREPPAMDASKSVFQVHAVTSLERSLSSASCEEVSLSRSLKKQVACTVVLEACGAGTAIDH